VNPPAESFYPDIRITTSLYKKARCLTALHIETRQINLLIAAARTYQLCFDLIDQLRMTLKAENSQLFLQLKLYNIYKQAIDNCFTLYELTGKSSWAEQAFEISERSKSIILLSELKDANAKKIGSIPEEYLTLEREVRKDINLYRNNILVEENQPEPDERKLIYLRSNLLTLEKKFDSLKNSFELNYPVYYRYKYDQSVVSPDQLKDILGKNEIMLEYSLSDKYLYIFLISRKKFEVKRILTDETLVRDIFSLRDNLDFDHVLDYTYDDYLEYQIVAHKLYTKLIQPFSNDLVNKKIIIIPDGELNYLSFESLLQKITPSDTIAFRYLPFLIKSNPISYAPTATIYSLIKKRGRAPGLQNGVLALAPSNTMLTRSILANEAVMKELLKYDFNLPGATHEAESILQVMKGRKLIGEDATEYEFKKNASQFDILHFATHTVIDDENPLSSTLSFYPYDGHDEDGMLHTYEIYNLELKGELAVLSACSTGNGKLLKGEGVISLARAFTYAGMPSVIMTLWDVEDISTGNIIPYFYHLLGKGYGKDIALRQAKLAYLGKTIPEIEMHPAFWSGFVLYGNNQGFRQKADHLQVILLIILAGLLFMISFIIIKRYIQYRKKLTRVDTDLSTEFQPEDRF
jgi:CHAT domain-containing protein